MENVVDLATQHLLALHQKIQAEREEATIKKVVKLYSSLYAYLRLYSLTDRPSERVDMESVLIDSITFLIRFADKEIEAEIDDLKLIYTELSSFLLLYAQEKQ